MPPQSCSNYLRNARNLRAIRAIYRNGEPVAEQCEHGEVVRSVRRGRRSPAAVRDMPVTLGHVRLHGLAPVPLTSPRCFPEFPGGRMTPLACRAAPAPAAAPARSSHHASSCSSLLMRKRRRSVTRSHDAQGARTRR